MQKKRDNRTHWPLRRRQCKRVSWSVGAAAVACSHAGGGELSTGTGCLERAASPSRLPPVPHFPLRPSCAACALIMLRWQRSSDTRADSAPHPDGRVRQWEEPHCWHLTAATWERSLQLAGSGHRGAATSTANVGRQVTIHSALFTHISSAFPT